MAKKDPTDLTVEEKLKALYQLQTTLSAIDEKRALRGEFPLEVQDLEDDIAGLTTRIEKIQPKSSSSTAPSIRSSTRLRRLRLAWSAIIEAARNG